MSPEKKIVSIEELTQALEEKKRRGLRVALSHGVFDILHPGIIVHLEEAKTQGDILVVTVIRDADVKRGMGRPVFSEELRARSVAKLELVDYVCIVSDDPPFQSVGQIKPDVFVEGKPQTKRDTKANRKIFEQERALYLEKIKVYQTQGIEFNTSNCLTYFADAYPGETVRFLRQFNDAHPLEDIVHSIEAISKLRVLLIGDTIVDEYHYCLPMGKSSKSNVVVNKYVNHEVFAGGVEAIANHMAGLCKEVGLVTVLGPEDSRERFIRDSLKPRVKPRLFYRNAGHTVVKKRYLDQARNQKLFEVNYLLDEFIDPACEQAIMDHVSAQVDNYDLLVISDFGHGLFTPRLREFVGGLGKRLALNTQTNGANAGFNLINRYTRPSFVCLDEMEARFAVQDKYSDIRDVARALLERLGAEFLIVTLGRHGALGVGSDGRMTTIPALALRTVDTVGAGDAFFAFSALCWAADMERDLALFVGNMAGALAVQILCNKMSVEKVALHEFLRSLSHFRSASPECLGAKTPNGLGT